MLHYAMKTKSWILLKVIKQFLPQPVGTMPQGYDL